MTLQRHVSLALSASAWYLLIILTTFTHCEAKTVETQEIANLHLNNRAYGVEVETNSGWLCGLRFGRKCKPHPPSSYPQAGVASAPPVNPAYTGGYRPQQQPNQGFPQPAAPPGAYGYNQAAPPGAYGYNQAAPPGAYGYNQPHQSPTKSGLQASMSFQAGAQQPRKRINFRVFCGRNVKG